LFKFRNNRSYKKNRKKYDYSESSIYATFISVLWLLIASLFTNIIELIISLCCISNCKCDCCDSNSCHDHYNNSLYQNYSEKKETEGNKETERNAAFIMYKREIKVERRIHIDVIGNNYV